MLLSLLGPAFCLILNHFYLMEKERKTRINMVSNQRLILKENIQSLSELHHFICIQMFANLEKDQQIKMKDFLISNELDEKNN